LLGAVAVLVPTQTSYAVGAGWIQRGARWVVTTGLRRVRLSGRRPWGQRSRQRPVGRPATRGRGWAAVL